MTAGINIIRPSHHDIKRYEGEKESSDGRWSRVAVKIKTSIHKSPCRKKNKLLLTAGINIIRPSQYDIKRYEGEKESSDDQERE